MVVWEGMGESNLGISESQLSTASVILQRNKSSWPAQKEKRKTDMSCD